MQQQRQLKAAGKVGSSLEQKAAHTTQEKTEHGACLQFHSPHQYTVSQVKCTA